MKKKKITAMLVCASVMVNMTVIPAFATNSTVQAPATEEESNLNIGAYTLGNNRQVNKLLEQYKFKAHQGHGFAAESGNNLIDSYIGKNAKVVGGDNAKNGADRLILGRDGKEILIQDKYHKTAASGINDCFDKDGNFRYKYAKENKPMVIEVPSDQYDEAVKLMEEKIKEGKLKNVGVTDPAEAKNIVKKGYLSYMQAANIAKAGTIESLVYDAANGVVTATAACGISTLIVFSLSVLNGESINDSLNTAVIEGLHTGGVVLGSSVVTSQLLRTNTVKGFEPVMVKVVDTFGDDFANLVVESAGAKVSRDIKAQAVKILSNQALMGGVTVLLLSADDIWYILHGEISPEQLMKNMVEATAGVAGGYAGSLAGTAVGSAVAPGVGSAVGSTVGTLVGGGVAVFVADKCIGYFFEDDAVKMMKIVDDNFAKISNDYLLTEDEVQVASEKISSELTGKKLRKMFAAKDKNQYANNIIKPIVKSVTANREKIKAPTEEELRESLKAELNGIVYIH